VSIPSEVNTPWLTIVSPTFNRATLLRAAMESVAVQGGAGVEHLVIDGGSSDGTSDLVVAFPQARMLSERDAGIYDAINKGLRLARGEVIGLLNSDDLYLPGALNAVREAFTDPAVEVVSGGAEVFREESGRRTVLQRYSGREQLALTLRNLTFGVPVINARFFRRSLIERVGPMDLRYAIAADREFLLRVALARPREAVLDRVLISYRDHADSLTLRAHVPAAVRYRAEHLEIAERYLAMPSLTWEERGTFRDWHREESAMLALGLALEGRLTDAARAAARGWQRSATWPLAVVECVEAAVRRRLQA
jgi:glycosyltransferase involved in cell wall biosynthesis